MTQTFIIGNREFTAQPMNAFAASKMFLQITKRATPLLAALGGKGLADLDVAQIGEVFPPEVLDEIVMPMMAESRVYANEAKKFIKDEASVNMVFSHEDLFDFFELAFEVGRYQFGPFFQKLAARFGVNLADLAGKKG
jgi:hypothetical protein